jgi:hypothetical protein
MSVHHAYGVAARDFEQSAAQHLDDLVFSCNGPASTQGGLREWSPDWSTEIFNSIESYVGRVRVIEFVQWTGNHSN